MQNQKGNKLKIKVFITNISCRNLKHRCHGDYFTELKDADKIRLLGLIQVNWICGFVKAKVLFNWLLSHL